MTYARTDLITETLANLGIVRLTDVSAPLTRVALVTYAAQILGVLPAGQTLSAEDSTKIDARIPTIIADLNARAVVTISDPNAISAGMFDALAAILANAARPGYEEGGSATSQLANDAVIAERKLYNFGGAAIVERNLDAIYAELGDDDLISLVDDSDIPASWFPSLAWIVADKVSGKFPLLPPDTVAKAKMQAMEAVLTLRRITRGRPSYNRAMAEFM